MGDPGADSLQLLQHLRRGQATLQIGHLARRHLALGLQGVASLGQLALHLVASLVQLAQSGQLLAQRPLLILGLKEGDEPRLDLVGLGQQRLMSGKLGLPLLPLPLQRLQLEPGLRLPCIQLVELRPVVPELGPERLHSLPGFLGLLQRAAERLRVLPRRLDLGLVLGASQQLGRDLIQPQVERALLLLDLAQPLLCPLLVHRPGRQAQDVAQHALPFRGGLHRELVRPALAQEGRVDEGVVVQPQHPLDLGLGIPDGALREGAPGSVILDLELEDGAAALARPSLAEDAEEIVTQLEGQVHLHLDPLEAEVDQLVIPARAGLTPQRPGQGIEQGGLAGAVLATQAGHVDAREVQYRLAVAHEVEQRELVRDHVTNTGEQTPSEHLATRLAANAKAAPAGPTGIARSTAPARRPRRRQNTEGEGDQEDRP